MSDPSARFPDEVLHAWVDGRLDAARAAELEAAMRDDPALAETLRAWRTQRDGLARLGRETLDEPVPDAMRARTEAALAEAAHATGTARRPAANGRRALATAAAVLAAAALGFVAGRGTLPADVPVARPGVGGTGSSAAGPGAGGTGASAAASPGAGGTGTPAATADAPTGTGGSGAPLADAGSATPARAVSDPSSPPGFVRAAAVAHGVYVPEVRHPVEVSGDQRGHLVAWLSKRLGATLVAPDLVPEGFELVGGRLLPGERGPSAQLMYQDAQGQRITLYVSRGEGAADATAFRFEGSGAVQSFYWIDRGLGYVLSGELPRERLSQLATTVYRALEAVPR